MGSAPRILLLEDDEVLSMVVTQMLEHLGCRVVMTSRGEDTVKEYVSALLTDPFKLIILDLTIDDGMGGADTAEKILALDPDAHVVISSGFGSDPMIKNYADYGFRNALKKPYVMDELNRVLEPILPTSTQGV